MPSFSRMSLPSSTRQISGSELSQTKVLLVVSSGLTVTPRALTSCSELRSRKTTDSWKSTLSAGITTRTVVRAVISCPVALSLAGILAVITVSPSCRAVTRPVPSTAATSGWLEV